jgi:glycosyltransferase involved in cell wall biosynthesis
MAVAVKCEDAPLVSVGLPVYNGERYLRQSIDSILNQTYREFEFIIVDNASTDSTEQICRDYARRDPRIRYHRNDVNIGAPRNFNKVFELSKGKYLKWSTSDDYCAPEYIEKCLEVMESNPEVVLCYPKAILIDAEGTHIGKYDDSMRLQQSLASERFIDLLMKIRLAHHHLGLIRSSELKRTSLHGAHIAADINFLAELTLYGKFTELPDYLLYRRLHPGSSSWDRKSRSRQLPRRKGVQLDSWAAMKSFFAAVRRSPTSGWEKRTMYKHLLRKMVWERRPLSNELSEALQLFYRRFLARIGRLAPGVAHILGKSREIW